MSVFSLSLFRFSDIKGEEKERKYYQATRYVFVWDKEVLDENKKREKGDLRKEMYSAISDYFYYVFKLFHELC